jgi:tagaturonate reductase
MKEITECIAQQNEMPERIMQFGEGNFLRGFADWMIHSMNEKNLFNGKVVVVQPIDRGMADLVNAQNGAYTVITRGVMNGKTVDETKLINPISRCINPYSKYEDYISCADNADLRFIISNTTEAGISYEAGMSIDDKPQKSFPGKITAFLYRRFTTFKGSSDKGIVLIPCELIDRNGDNLKKIVLRHAEEWKLGTEFIAWLQNSCAFLNSLVDRIVPGYPKDEAEAICEKLGYWDDLLDTVEPFHLWVIEGDEKYGKELPFDKAGLNVVWTKDMTPYRTRKVRILNGAHTTMVLAAYLSGLDIVLECMNDNRFKSYLRKALENEIIPTLELPKSELESFAASTLERFANPFIKHQLLSISLNSVSKFKARVLPSLVQFTKLRNELPPILTFSLASLISFYRGTSIIDGALVGKRNGETYRIMDDKDILESFAAMWREFEGSSDTDNASKTLVHSVLTKDAWWGEDLTKIPALEDAVSEWVKCIEENGISEALASLLGGDKKNACA